MISVQPRAGAPSYLWVPLLCGLLAACQSVPPATTAKPVSAPNATGATPAASQAEEIKVASTPAAASPATPSPEPFRNNYSQEKDSVPATHRAVDYMAIPDAVPKAEPRGKYGNKSPYRVLGRNYHVMASASGYKAEGVASWYGEKFHGHRTSSFEPYDMYAMTAAHTTLPIPSYVRVTNLDNDRSVIVRVNDRGPFHRGRIIDLSWAAAQKLGYAGKGTARVRVEAVEPDAAAETIATTTESVESATAAESPANTPAVMPAADAVGAGAEKTPAVSATEIIANKPPGSISDDAHGFFIQLGAFTFPDTARQLGERVRATVGEPVTVTAGDDALHRVRVGPYEDRASAERIRDLLRLADLGTPSLVFVPAPASP